MAFWLELNQVLKSIRVLLHPCFLQNLREYHEDSLATLASQKCLIDPQSLCVLDHLRHQLFPSCFQILSIVLHLVDDNLKLLSIVATVSEIIGRDQVYLGKQLTAKLLLHHLAFFRLKIMFVVVRRRVIGVRRLIGQKQRDRFLKLTDYLLLVLCSERGVCL